jgi:glycerol-3-phosphate acyltransferase PlsY
MPTFVFVLVGSYLLGSIPFGYLAGRIRGIDIRKVGSGNIGATNVVRVFGKRYGYPVFVLDFLKGLGAVRIAMAMAVRPESISPELVGVLGAVSAVIGHSFPIWLKFRGGKGVSTSAGALFGLMPLATVIGAAIWILTFLLTRYVSVASVATAVALPFVIAIMTWLNQTDGKALFYSSLCLAAVIIWRHHSNLSRLVRGTEPRFTRK